MSEALLVIDIQNDYFRGGKMPLKGMAKAARRAAACIEEFRADGNPVIYIQHISRRPGSRFFLPDTEGAKIHASVTPHEGAKVIVKYFPNSFRETGLHDVLQELGITTLHIVGAMTNMCVDTTTRAAFDLGYSVVVHKDACAAPALLGTSLIHRIYIRNLGSVFAEIV